MPTSALLKTGLRMAALPPAPRAELFALSTNTSAPLLQGPPLRVELSLATVGLADPLPFSPAHRTCVVTLWGQMAWVQIPAPTIMSWVSSELISLGLSLLICRMGELTAAPHRGSRTQKAQSISTE